MENTELRTLLLALTNAKESFIAGLVSKFSEDQDNADLILKRCSNGHLLVDFLPDIFSRFFNVMSKNYVSEVNDVIHLSRKRKEKDQKEQSSSQRKLAKLQSKKK